MKQGKLTLSWTVHHLDSWIKIDQLDVTCFIISLFTAQHVSNVITSIFRSLRLIVDFFHVLCCSGSMCVGVTVWFSWGGVVSLCRLKLLLRVTNCRCASTVRIFLITNLRLKIAEQNLTHAINTQRYKYSLIFHRTRKTNQILLLM